MIKSTILSFTALTLVGCSSNTEAGMPNTNPSPIGKSSAPMRIEASHLGVADAKIQLTFEQAAKGVTVEVYGVDGLQVFSEPKPIQDGSFTAGQTQVLDVGYRQGEGSSLLAVHVKGEFGGVQDKKVVTFRLGKAQEKAPEGEVEVDSEGKKVHVIPAKKR